MLTWELQLRPHRTSHTMQLGGRSAMGWVCYVWVGRVKCGREVSGLMSSAVGQLDKSRSQGDRELQQLLASL